MEIKKSEILNLWYVFQNSKHESLPKEYSYFIAKNKLAIEPIVIEFEKRQEPTPRYKEYDEKRSKLAQTLADRVEDTQLPKINKGEYVITKRRDEFQKVLGELKAAYKDEFEARKTQIEALNKDLTTSVDVDVTKIKYEDVPQTIAPSVVETFIVTGLLDK